jgi:hypothetical protein
MKDITQRAMYKEILCTLGPYIHIGMPSKNYDKSCQPAKGLKLAKE